MVLDILPRAATAPCGLARGYFLSPLRGFDSALARRFFVIPRAVFVECVASRDNMALSCKARFPLILAFSLGEKGLLYRAQRSFTNR